MTQQCRIVLAGPLSEPARAAIDDRFTATTITSDAATTVVELACADQPAVRAVLTLLWDLGHNVLSLTHDG
ncbi:MAG: hypothetical protein QOH17_2539 [Pseudonocardiales bacterium]|nr:hypothetical protein [Pseudonocardiales bacterium]